MDRRLIGLRPARSCLAAAAMALACSVLAQGVEPVPEFVDRHVERPPRLQVDDPGCRPAYPEAARGAQLQGDSHLILRFDPNGEFVSVQILGGAEATPLQRGLDIAAAKALAGCPFHPGIDAKGRSVGGDIEVTYHWPMEPPRDGGEARILAQGRECRPGYPVAALRANAQGTTKLAFHLDETGKVLGVDIVRSAGDTRAHRLLDAAAAQGLATCPFQPIQDAAGKPVPGTVTLTYTWRLE